MRDMKRTALALVVGGIGGGLFFIADLPLAWMLGSMCFSTVAALRGVNLAVNGTLRKIMTAILGVMLGCGFSTDTLERHEPMDRRSPPPLCQRRAFHVAGLSLLPPDWQVSTPSQPISRRRRAA